MKMRIFYTLGLIAMLTTILAASQVCAQYAYSNYGETKQGTVTLFAATDTKSSDSGYGLSLTLKDDPTSAVTYVHLDSFDIYQVTKSKPTQLAGYPVNMGISLGYANRRNNAADVPNGLLTGLDVSVSLGKPKSNFSVDLRASSLARNVNPIKWVTNPDVLWLGAGVTFKY